MSQIIAYFIHTLVAAWNLLLDSAPYMVFGLITAGLLKVHLDPALISRHLGRGRFWPVLKASLLGIPVPLCSCGVLPAAAQLKRQGANRGAVASFLISTPESGVDSIAATYALLDPVMTVARPVAAFASAMVAGLAENYLGKGEDQDRAIENPDISCPVDGCCDGVGCDPKAHSRHHTFWQKGRAGLAYAFGELWGDLAAWFLVGLLAAGLITALAPADFFKAHLGGGIGSMLLMLLVGIPLYVCATASTPIAAALILKGVSPGAALVFLLAGPATNLTSLTMLLGVLGKRATVIYLSSIAVMSILAGLALDVVYGWLGVGAGAMVGQAAELAPEWLRWAAGLGLLAISIKPAWHSLLGVWARFSGRQTGQAQGASCGCGHGHDHGHDHGQVSVRVQAPSEIVKL